MQMPGIYIHDLFRRVAHHLHVLAFHLPPAAIGTSTIQAHVRIPYTDTGYYVLACACYTYLYVRTYTRRYSTLAFCTYSAQLAVAVEEEGFVVRSLRVRRIH